MIGSTLADLFIPADMRERHRLGLHRLVTTGEGPILNRRIEVSALRHDGTEFPVELTVTQVEGAGSPPVLRLPAGHHDLPPSHR